MDQQLQSLFASAVVDGALTQAGANVIVPDMGANITAALGVAVDDVDAANIMLVTAALDDSGSIGEVPGNADAMRSGANIVVDAMRGAKGNDGTLVAVWTLNRGPIQPYATLDQVPRFTEANVPIDGYTPLYDRTAEMLGAVVAKAADAAKSGVPVRTITLIVTDGADYGSRTHKSPEAVAPLIKSMIGGEAHIIAFMGIDDGQTDFRSIARRMGIPDKWILTPKNNAKDIRASFLLFSQSAVRASQAIDTSAFSGVSGGGFASP